MPTATINDYFPEYVPLNGNTSAAIRQIIAFERKNLPA
jgi:hypothetical protein